MQNLFYYSGLSLFVILSIYVYSVLLFYIEMQMTELPRVMRPS